MLEKFDLLLRNLESLASSASARDLSMFKDPEGERMKIYSGAAHKLMQDLKTEIAAAQLVLGNAKGQLFHVTAVPEPKKDDVVGAINADNRRKEIRESLKSMGRKDAHNLLKKKIDEGDLTFLHAVIDDPVKTFSSDFINLLRLDYARRFKHKFVENYSKAQEFYDKTRKLCASYSGEATQILTGLDLKNPITMKERAEVFPARSIYESVLINKRIEKEWREQQTEERKKELED